jgi:predicted permease
MTGQMAIVTNQIIVFSILMTIGFIAAKTKVLTKDALNIVSKLIVKIILPALIFSVVAGSGVTIKDFVISGRFALAVVFCFVSLSLIGILMSKVCKLEGKTSNIFIALATFSNIGFMGIPLIQALYVDPIAQVCISVYTLVDMALLWTYGVYLCSRHQQHYNSLAAIKNIINPTTIALFIAFTLLVFDISVPAPLMNTISGLGGTSKYWALMYLGGALAYVSVGNILKKPSTIVLAIVKMIMVPIGFYYISGFFLPQIPRAILTLIIGLPPMTAIAMIASTYNSADEYAAEVIFVLTVASLLTIPLVTGITSMM